MQPYFLPYIGYWQLINASDKIIIYDDVKYTKKGWINRNSFLSRNKKIKKFSIYLNKSSDQSLINEKTISEEWNKERVKILSNIYLTYKESISFKSKFKIIEEIFMHEDKNLFNFILNSIERIKEYLEIETEVLISSKIIDTQKLKKEKKIFALSRKIDEKEYLNFKNGEKMYSKKTFSENNLKLFFINKNFFKYNQNTKKFYDNLSIIDLIMRNNKKKIKEFLNCYEII